jgi:hypothetical protein
MRKLSKISVCAHIHLHIGSYTQVDSQDLATSRLALPVPKSQVD